jgi:hypothetical protein
MRFRYTTILLCATALLLIGGCDVDVEDKGKLPDVDVKGDAGQLPKYDVEKTQEGRLPDVDVDAEPGRMPKVDVQGPDVDVGTKPVTVPVPDVNVDMPNEQDNNPPAQQ